MANPEVEVLLATYNGERFLREQIDSLLAQEYSPLRITARDDGSIDATMTILQEYAQLHPGRFNVIEDASPTGAARWNFVRLLQASTAPYVAFCDQDDVWLPGKVGLSMQAMQTLEARHGHSKPLLVFSDLVVSDSQLQTLSPSFWKQQGICAESVHSLRHLIGVNVLTGCTAVLNRPLANLAARMPSESPMHDRWVALLACVLGASTVLPQATMLYRQHGGNVIGAGSRQNSVAEIARRTRNSEARLKQWRINQRLALALLREYGEQISGTDRQVLHAYRVCDTDPSRLVRVITWLRFGFFRPGLLRNLATLWDLWNLKPDPVAQVGSPS